MHNQHPHGQQNQHRQRRRLAERLRSRKSKAGGAVAVADSMNAFSAPRVRTMWEHTLLIFSSDNGAPVGQHGANLPLRAGKDSFFEGGVRTVAALGGGWLPSITRNLRFNSVMHESDWYATLCAAARVAASDVDAAAGMPPVDGVSMWQQWSREVAHQRNATHSRTAPNLQRVRAPRDAGAAAMRLGHLLHA
eukprot:2309272-Pleurochrysis_carterae.AAC.3